MVNEVPSKINLPEGIFYAINSSVQIYSSDYWYILVVIEVSFLKCNAPRSILSLNEEHTFFPQIG